MKSAGNRLQIRQVVHHIGYGQYRQHPQYFKIPYIPATPDRDGDGHPKQREKRYIEQYSDIGRAGQIRHACQYP